MLKRKTPLPVKEAGFSCYHHTSHLRERRASKET